MIELQHSLESCYHVTVLSNFARTYDKYRRHYRKSEIPESSYPNEFFLLRRSELDVGVRKAESLLERLDRSRGRLLVVKTTVRSSELRQNVRTGLGRFVPRRWIGVDEVFYFEAFNELESQTVEAVCARSIASLEQEFPPYENLVPRSFSVLPEAIGCQASCPFCFSKASVSLEQHKQELTSERVVEIARMAIQRGATRAVVTGGGEPGMLAHDELEKLLRILAARFEKTVLIANGEQWTSKRGWTIC